MTMVWVAGWVAVAAAGWLLTFCCSFDLRLPAASACLRRRCTEAITASGWARKASPIFCTQAGSWPSTASNCGKATSDCTLGSQGWLATCFTASSPLASLCAADHFTASATSPG